MKAWWIQLFKSMFQSQSSIGNTCASSNKDTIDQFPIDIEDTEGSRRKSLIQSSVRRGSSAIMLIKKEHANTMLVRCIVEGNLSFNLLKMSWRNMLLASLILEKSIVVLPTMI